MVSLWAKKLTMIIDSSQTDKKKQIRSGSSTFTRKAGTEPSVGVSGGALLENRLFVPVVNTL